MNLDQFIEKYNGKRVCDLDGGYCGECLSLVKRYISEVFGINPPPSGVNSAYGYWSNFPDPLGAVFEKIPNTPSGIPQKGDIIIWGLSAGSYGHISIFIEGTAGSFRSFDQNWSVGSNSHIQGHYYNNVIGWLHPKGDNMNGLKLFDNNGQVWAVFDNKQFYVEDPKSIEGLSIVKGEPYGEILIKQKDQDARLAQLRAEMQGQIDARDIQIRGLNAKIEQLKDEKVTLKAQIDECKKEVELLRGLLQDESEAASTCETARDKLQKQIDEHKCEVKELTAWELVKELFKKLFK